VQNVKDMVIRDRNRPSVIVWGTRLNESDNFVALYDKTREVARHLDGSRQSTGAMHRYSVRGWDEDLFAYDDYESHHGNARLKPPIGELPYLVSEAVGALSGAALYRWIDTSRTLALQARMHAQVHNIVRSTPQYAGLLGWAGIDYASLNGGNRISKDLKWAGVLDTFRVAKPGAAIYRSQVDPAERAVIVPAFFWDFGPESPRDGPGRGAMIATNCDRLALHLDSQPLTTATPDVKKYGNLAYPPVFVDLTVDGSGLPELRVDGYLRGELVCALRMSSDPSHDLLAVELEDRAIAADGIDTTRATFRAVDAYGNQRPYVTGDVTLTLSGPAELIADNPFPFATYGGVGGAFVRSRSGACGIVTITAQHPTLGTARAQLRVSPSSDYRVVR